MSKRDLNKIVQNIQDLPSLPVVVTKMLEVIEDSRSASKDLADVISKDQAFTTKVLRLVNSAFYGFSTRISTLDRATVILGYNTIKNLVLGLSVVEFMEGTKEGSHFNRVEFWEHCLGCAACARLIATKTGYTLPEEAFVAGLLHDIGKVIFDEHLNDDFNQVLESVKNNSISMTEAEDKILGTTHPIIGEWLAKEWKLPLVLRNAIRYHHSPPVSSKTIEETSIICSSIVHISDILCKIGGIGSDGDVNIPSIDRQVLKRINLEENSTERILSEIDQELVKAKAFLGVSVDNTFSISAESPAH